MADQFDRESKLDETADETFPASDPPANTGETGILLAIDQNAALVRDNREEHRFGLGSWRRPLQVIAVCPFVKAYLRRHPGSVAR